MQRKLRHRRARPRQWVDHDDGLWRSHANRRGSAGHKADTRRKRRGAWCSGTKAKKMGALGAKC
jgi:hypothetical protein